MIPVRRSTGRVGAEASGTATHRVVTAQPIMSVFNDENYIREDAHYRSDMPWLHDVFLFLGPQLQPCQWIHLIAIIHAGGNHAVPPLDWASGPNCVEEGTGQERMGRYETAGNHLGSIGRFALVITRVAPRMIIIDTPK